MTATTPVATPTAPPYPRLDRMKPSEVKQLIAQARNALLADTDPCQQPEIDDKAMQQRFAEASALCAKGDYKSALAIVAVLFASAPDQWSLAFVMGTCLQRGGHPALAIVYFGIAAVVGGDPASLFRLAECHERLGHAPQAAKAYDNVARLTQKNPKQAALHAEAVKAATALRAASAHATAHR